MDKKEFWFYLEPYTFLTKGECNYLLYNSINNKQLLVERNPLLDNIFNDLLINENLYCTKISENVLKKIKHVVCFLRTTFSGDVISTLLVKNKPSVFPPIPFILNNYKLTNAGEVFSPYLNEISMYLPTKNSGKYNQLDYYKQYILPKKIRKIKDTSLCYFESFVNQMPNNISPRINLIGGDIWNDDRYASFILSCKKHTNELTFISDIEDYLECYKDSLDQGILYNCCIDVNSYKEKEIFQKVDSTLKKVKIDKFIFTVVSEDNVMVIEKLIDFFGILNFEILPVYDNNYSFIENNVCLSKEELENFSISKTSVLRNMTINSTYFGKILINESGKVFTGTTHSLNLNINNDTLGVIISKALRSKKSMWMKTRDKLTCSNCEYRYLCPPVSELECCHSIVACKK
jgi:pseudo-rSAM protein